MTKVSKYSQALFFLSYTDTIARKIWYGGPSACIDAEVKRSTAKVTKRAYRYDCSSFWLNVRLPCAAGRPDEVNASLRGRRGGQRATGQTAVRARVLRRPQVHRLVCLTVYCSISTRWGKWIIGLGGIFLGPGDLYKMPSNAFLLHRLSSKVQQWASARRRMGHTNQ